MVGRIEIGVLMTGFFKVWIHLGVLLLLSCVARVQDRDQASVSGGAQQTNFLSSGTNWRAAYSEVRTPIGVNQSLFNRIVQLFREEIRENASVQSMILYGSRLHFDYGNSPKPDSDLDVAVFFKVKPEPLARITYQETLNEKLKRLGRNDANFPIAEQIPLMISFSDALDGGSFLSKSSYEEEKRKWQQILGEQNPQKQDLRLRGSFHKQSLILLADDEECEDLATRLSTMDYKNIIFVSK